jgi:hypothetical protein
MRLGRVFIGGFLFIALLVIGFFLLIRGCLARYDERSALAPVLYFEKGRKAVLFSLVQYDNTTSYSQSGSMVRKSVSTSYYVQQNDAVSGVRTAQQKVKHHSDIKYHPIETMGASQDLAWVFLGELMAFDPFTLEKKADIAILESKNPSLKGLFPGEKRFYQFNNEDKQLYFTASDGTKWQLNTSTLLATATTTPYDPNRTPADADSHQVRRLSAWRSLQRLNPSYTQIKTNQDTMGGKWYGLYAADEWAQLYGRVQQQSTYDETARGQLYMTSYSPASNGDMIIEKTTASRPSPSAYFLHGGFLLDKSTGLPMQLAGLRGYLIVHKDKIGQEGKILLSRLNEQGQVSWTYATGLSSWVDWLYNGKQLFVMGVDNPELSSSQCNVLLCIDLATGKANKHDYFADKK